MYKRLLACIALFACLSSPIAALASDISNALYYGVITISNATTTAYTTDTVSCNISTANLITGNYLNATASNCAVRNTSGTDVAFMPGSGSSNWTFWLPSIGAQSSLNYLLYTANTTGGKLAYFPDTTGMTITDHASLEPSDNFSSLFTGYVDTTNTTQPITYKTGAYSLRVGTASGNITADIFNGYVSPTSDNSTTWATPDNIRDGNTGTTSTIGGVGAGTWTTYIEADYSSSQAMDSCKVYLSSSVPSALHLVEVSAYYNSTWNVVFSGGFTNAAWTTLAFTTPVYASRLQFRAYNGTGGAVGFTLGEVQMLTGLRFSLAGITSGEHTIRFTEDSTNGWLDVDSTLTPTQALLGTITDNANDWIIGSTATPYITSYKHYVGGVLKSDISWHYNALAPYVFTDASGNGNNAVPTFRTSSSESNILASFSAFTPVSQAQAPAYTLESVTPLVAESSFGDSAFTTNVTPTFPGAAIITAISAASGTPQQFPFKLGAGLLLIAVSYVTTWGLRKAGSGNLFFKVMAVIMVAGLMVSVHWLDLWWLIFFIMLSVPLLLSKTRG